MTNAGRAACSGEQGIGSEDRVEREKALMKMVMIAYNEAVDEEVMETLAACCDLVAFTKWTKVLGQGTHSEPHLLDHIWPKGNDVLMACVDDQQAAAIMARVRELRKTLGKEGLKAFAWSVDDVT
mgnify:CR=1 FL=1